MTSIELPFQIAILIAVFAVVAVLVGRRRGAGVTQITRTRRRKKDSDDA